VGEEGGWSILVCALWNVPGCLEPTNILAPYGPQDFFLNVLLFLYSIFDVQIVASIFGVGRMCMGVVAGENKVGGTTSVNTVTIATRAVSSLITDLSTEYSVRYLAFIIHTIYLMHGTPRICRLFGRSVYWEPRATFPTAY